MPWIDKELCTGCQTCIDQCSVGAISMEENIAIINDDECIRCAVCHDVCQENAVRHDGERIPEEVQANIDWAEKLLTHEYYANDKKKQRQLIDRLQRFFTKDKKVAEKTIEQLVILQNEKYAD